MTVKLKSEEINVLCSTDENYAPYCGIMLTSLLETNITNKINIFILSSGLSENSIERFRKLSKKYSSEIILITPDDSIFNKLRIRPGDHVTKATYYRIACAEYLPENIEKIIYLDCDILVNTDLSDLWNTSLEKNFCGAVIDSYAIDAQKRLGIDTPYFNSGVLLLDIQKFKENNIFEKCIEVFNQDPERIKMHDQDLLNIVLGGKVKFLPVKYNMMSAFLRIEHLENKLDKALGKEIKEAVKNPNELIVHFEYFPKPWNKDVMIQNPFAGKWRKYRKMSFWPGAPLTSNADFIQKLRVKLLNALWLLKLKRKPKYYLIEKVR